MTILQSIFLFLLSSSPHPHTLSLHDALPIYIPSRELAVHRERIVGRDGAIDRRRLYVSVELPGELGGDVEATTVNRSEEHTSELQSRQYLVCRLLFENKKIIRQTWS